MEDNTSVCIDMECISFIELIRGIYMKLNTRREIPYLKLSEDQANISEQFLKTYEHCRRFLIITEDFRGKTDDVSSIERHIEVLLKGLCNHSNGKLFGF